MTQTPPFNDIIPTDIAPPFANYAHGVVVPAGRRLLLVSGQLGMDVDGTIPDTVAAQARLCFANIDAILRDAGGSRADTVRLNAYVTDRADLAGYMAERDAWLGGIDRTPASTLMIVSGFAREAFRVEIEATAAVPA